MGKDRKHHLGDLQYAIMRVLWSHREATVADVHARLPESQRRALTTIATMLQKMERKGIVEHRAEGRQYVYLPTIQARDVHRSMVGSLTDLLFEGNVTALVTHLLDEQAVDPSELDGLRDLIARKRGEVEGGGSDD